MHIALTAGDYLILAALLFVIGRVTALGGRDDGSVAAKNARKLDSIIKFLNVPDLPTSRPGQLTEAVRVCVDRGQTVDAIKLYRTETGAGIKEAKSAIDEYRARSKT